jgi:hypothetical protein
MIHDICEILKNKIINEPYVDKIAGLVQVAQDVQSSKQGSIVKRFPIACDVTGKDCADATFRLSELVPNSKNKSVIYFEDISGVTFRGQERNEFIFQARPRLVCWLNQKQLGKNECSITPLVVANIIKALGTNKRFNDGLYIKAMIQVAGQVTKTPAIFQRYTYDEKTTQFLMFPFDYFALDIVVEFRINSDCIGDWIVEPPEVCLDK